MDRFFLHTIGSTLLILTVCNVTWPSTHLQWWQRLRIPIRGRLAALSLSSCGPCYAQGSQQLVSLQTPRFASNLNPLISLSCFFLLCLPHPHSLCFCWHVTCSIGRIPAWILISANWPMMGLLSHVPLLFSPSELWKQLIKHGLHTFYSIQPGFSQNTW